MFPDSQPSEWVRIDIFRNRRNDETGVFVLKTNIKPNDEMSYTPLKIAKSDSFRKNSTI